MTNIQDDQLISQYSDDSASTVSDEPALNNDGITEPEQPVINNDEVAKLEQPVASNDEATKSQPSRADVDELISQLDALHQEIAAKTVVPQASAEGTLALENTPAVEKTPTIEVQTDEAQVQEDKEVEKLIAPPVTPMIGSSDDPQLAQPPTTPMIESSDDPQLPPTQTSDADLDKFIEELEAKIADNKQEVEQKPSFAEEEQVAQPEPTGEANMPDLQQLDVAENFSHQRPSLDLSEINQDKHPDLTLHNGQLEEEQSSSDQPAETETETEAETPALTPEEAVDAEDLESQNIFAMLGLDHLEQSEKEAFLDDLEKLIWDNFVEVELAQLLNIEEKAQAEQILADSTKSDDERKEALLLYLEKFIPNLEEIMYKKALLLKKEMFEERIRKSRQQASEENNLSLMADLDQIQELIKAERYKTAIALLNKN